MVTVSFAECFNFKIIYSTNRQFNIVPNRAVPNLVALSMALLIVRVKRTDYEERNIMTYFEVLDRANAINSV